MKYASIGSVSHGTMRSQDLLPEFGNTLQQLVKANIDEISPADAFRYGLLVGTCETLVCLPEAFESQDWNDQATDTIDELFNALNDFAPQHAYFGAHEGDGSDYGFWIESDFLSDPDSFDVLRVSDTSEVPTNFCGEVLHVNHHGNATLYAADHGKLTEIWGVV